MNSRTSNRGTGRRAPKSSRIELTEEERLEIRSAFDIFDADKNGKIDKHELTVCVKAMGFNVGKNEIDDLIREKGEGPKHFLSFQDFQEFMGMKMKTRNQTEEYKKAFKLFKDGEDGNITIDDIRKLAKEMNSGLTEEDLQTMIREFDRDGDGEISMAEFIEIMDPSSVQDK